MVLAPSMVYIYIYYLHQLKFCSCKKHKSCEQQQQQTRCLSAWKPRALEKHRLCHHRSLATAATCILLFGWSNQNGNCLLYQLPHQMGSGESRRSNPSGASTMRSYHRSPCCSVKSCVPCHRVQILESFGVWSKECVRHRTMSTFNTKAIRYCWWLHGCSQK